MSVNCSLRKFSLKLTRNPRVGSTRFYITVTINLSLVEVELCEGVDAGAD